MKQFAMNCLAVACTLLPLSSAFAEIFDLGGMYTYHYRDGRYADWGDYALHGAHLAIREMNASGILGDDQLRLKPENTIDYHCWPENAALMAETLMQKDILVLTGADCSGPAVEIAKVAARYEVPVISNGANASMLSSAQDFPWFVRVVTPSEAYEGYLIDVAAHFGVKEIGYFHTTDAWGLGARKVIHDYCDRNDIGILQEYGFARDTDYETIAGYLTQVKTDARHRQLVSRTPCTRHEHTRQFLLCRRNDLRRRRTRGGERQPGLFRANDHGLHIRKTDTLPESAGISIGSGGRSELESILLRRTKLRSHSRSRTRY